MKKLLIILAFFLSLGATAQGVEFKTTSFDFGTVKEDGGVVEHRFAYTNTSKTPFVITDISTSCGCTNTEYSSKPLLQGETAEIIVRFDPMDRPGRNAKQVRILSNQGEYSLRIIGNVTPRVRTLEEKFPFPIGDGARLDILAFSATTVPLGDPHEVYITVANSSRTTSVCVEVDENSLPKGVTYKKFDNMIAPRGTQDIKFMISGDKYGSFIHNVRLKVNGKVKNETISIGGAVVLNTTKFSDSDYEKQPLAKFSSRFINLGMVKVGETITKKITIKNEGSAPLEIFKIEPSRFLKVKASSMTAKVGGAITITVDYTPELDGYDSQNVRIFLNDPRLPMCDVKIVGEVL